MRGHAKHLFLIAFLTSFLFAERVLAQTNCTSTLNWSCFESTVAIVGRSSTNQVLSFCSGVAIDPNTIVTAGHCVESLADPSIVEIQIYTDSVVQYDRSPTAIADRLALHLDRLYDRDASYFHHDRGMLKLTSPLSHLAFPKVDRRAARTITQGTTLQRIGFGQRETQGGSSSGRLENRRTWVQSKVYTAMSETFVTEDQFASPGDSGGPLFLFLPGEGLFFVGVHSTLDVRSGLVYSPRIL
ncbi:MAG: trypsin-like serine protease [Deltaproteobacteria bacterium]|nr:trypsin-like serine protease [Deltaproteobacteria bacterium]